MNDDPGSTPAVDGVCEQCGFDYDALGHDEVIEKLHSFGKRYHAPVTRGLPGEALDDLVREHPLEGVWSALEYVCHVRDVFAVQRERVAQVLAEDTPTLVPMGGGIGREALAVRNRYNEQDPVAAAEDLARNSATMAGALEVLTDDEWDRRCVYGYPTPTERDLTWLAHHTVHEGHHHLLDVGRVLRAARGRG